MKRFGVTAIVTLAGIEDLHICFSVSGDDIPQAWDAAYKQLHTTFVTAAGIDIWAIKQEGDLPDDTDQ